jgi:putative endonuclease
VSLRVTTQTRGKLAEDAACRYLTQHGLVLLESNFRGRGGEIDLIMRDGKTLVFVEVRHRSDNRFMHAVETIDNRKRTRIIAASQEYLQQHKCGNDICRFDLLLIQGRPGAARIEWIKNAFEA